MADETLVKSAPEQTSSLEAAEIRAWRVDKVRRLPRRARLWTWRVVAFCIGAVLVLVVLGEVLATATSLVGSAAHNSLPRQK